MNFYIYELPKCLLTWENTQCNDDDDGNIGRYQGLAGGLAGDDQFLFPFLFIPKDTQKTFRTRLNPIFAFFNPTYWIHWIHTIQAQSTIQWLCHCRRLRQIPSISLNHLFYKEAGAVQFHIYSITGSHPPHRWKNTQEILNSRWRIITQKLSLTKKDLDGYVLQIDIHNVRYNI